MRRPGTGAAFSLVLAALGAAFATASCSREDLTVATLSSTVTPEAGADAAVDTGVSSEPPCTTDQDCRDDEYCDKPGCGKIGTCQVPTCDDDGEKRPACGCNNITYYNSCELQKDGQSMRHPDPCEDDGFTPTCQDQSDCQSLGLTRAVVYCSRLVVGDHDCDPQASGTCWVLPRDCSTVTNDDDPDYLACMSPDLSCESQCQAIANGVPYSFEGDTCH